MREKPCSVRLGRDRRIPRAAPGDDGCARAGLQGNRGSEPGMLGDQLGTGPGRNWEEANVLLRVGSAFRLLN